MIELWQRLAGQTRAVANAREAATSMARARVERTEVEEYLASRYRPSRSSRPA